MPIEGLEGLKYSHQEYEHQCLSLVIKDWDQQTAQAVDVFLGGSIIARLRSTWRLHWLITVSWTNLSVDTVNFIAYSVIPVSV